MERSAEELGVKMIHEHNIYMFMSQLAREKKTH